MYEALTYVFCTLKVEIIWRYSWHKKLLHCVTIWWQKLLFPQIPIQSLKLVLLNCSYLNKTQFPVHPEVTQYLLRTILMICLKIWGDTLLLAFQVELEWICMYCMYSVKRQTRFTLVLSRTVVSKILCRRREPVESLWGWGYSNNTILRITTLLE